MGGTIRTDDTHPIAVLLLHQGPRDRHRDVLRDETVPQYDQPAATPHGEEIIMKRPGILLGVGIAIGAGIGAALGNVAIGIAIGVAVGAALSASQRNR